MWPLFPRPFLGRLSCWTRADMSVGAAPNGRRGRTGAISVHLPAALPSRRLLSITNCPLRWRPRALRAFPRGSANPSPNSARARNGTPDLRGVVVRLAQAPCYASIGLRPAKECSRSEANTQHKAYEDTRQSVDEASGEDFSVGK